MVGVGRTELLTKSVARQTYGRCGYCRPDAISSDGLTIACTVTDGLLLMSRAELQIISKTKWSNITSGLEWMPGGAFCLHSNAIGPAPLRPDVKTRLSSRVIHSSTGEVPPSFGRKSPGAVLSTAQRTRANAMLLTGRPTIASIDLSLIWSETRVDGRFTPVP